MSTATTASSLVPNSDNFDMYEFTALAGPIGISADTGTLTNGRRLMFRFLDNNTPRGITWASQYTTGSSTIAIPSTTTANKIMHIGYIYDSSNSLAKYLAIAYATQ